MTGVVDAPGNGDERHPYHHPNEMVLHVQQVERDREESQPEHDRLAGAGQRRERARRSSFDARVRGAHDRQEEDREPYAERQQDVAQGAEVVPPHPHIDRQSGKHEDAADIAEQARQDAAVPNSLERRVVAQGRRDLVKREFVPPDDLDDLDERILLRAHVS